MRYRKCVLLFKVYLEINPFRAHVRSSHWKCSIKIGVFKNFANSHKNTCTRFFLKKKRFWHIKTLWHRCFPVNFANFLRTPFLQNTVERLILPCFISIPPENSFQGVNKWNVGLKLVHPGMRLFRKFPELQKSEKLVLKTILVIHVKIKNRSGKMNKYGRNLRVTGSIFWCKPEAPLCEVYKLYFQNTISSNFFII